MYVYTYLHIAYMYIYIYCIYLYDWFRTLSNLLLRASGAPVATGTGCLPDNAPAPTGGGENAAPAAAAAHPATQQSLDCSRRQTEADEHSCETVGDMRT